MGEISKDIGDNIKRRREELGLSLQEVADRAGMSKANVWELERWRNPNPTLRSILALTQALSMSLDELLGIDTAQPILTEKELALVAAHRQIFGREP